MEPIKRENIACMRIKGKLYHRDHVPKGLLFKDIDEIYTREHLVQHPLECLKCEECGDDILTCEEEKQAK
ncbi:MAG TPA: hypothetical protein VMU10_00375 [Desulfomonilia bacterium]|nr:hypothetical protein [Desulfomonilia bacterium]